MSDQSRDEKLATFEAVTGSSDVGEALVYLEAADWDLEAAVSNALISTSVSVPQHQRQTPSTSLPGTSLSPGQQRPPRSASVGKRHKRPVIIDGMNVGHAFGRNTFLGLRGVLVAYLHFAKLGHDVQVYLPRQLSKASQLRVEDYSVRDSLRKHGVLREAPGRQNPLTGRFENCYDDYFVVKAAADTQGVILSNDQYRDLFTKHAELRTTISERLLSFEFADDSNLILPPDPRGRLGPSLEDFMHFPFGVNPPRAPDTDDLLRQMNELAAASTPTDPLIHNMVYAGAHKHMDCVYELLFKMSDQSRDEKLATFQAVTGNSDVGEALVYLEAADWDLETAVSNALASTSISGEMPEMPQVQQPIAPAPIRAEHHAAFNDDFIWEGVETRPANPFAALRPRRTSPPPPRVENHDDPGIGIGVMKPEQPRMNNDIVSGPSAASSSRFNVHDFIAPDKPEELKNKESRKLNFAVEFKDKEACITLSDSERIYALKKRLETEFGVKAGEIHLSGWRNVPETDLTRLSSLSLPINNRLVMLTEDEVTTTPCLGATANGPSGAGTSAGDDSMIARLQAKYAIQLIDLDTGTPYTLKVDGSKSIRELKCDATTLTGILPSRQAWAGWPEWMADIDDDEMVLANCGFDEPLHELTVRRKQGGSGQAQERRSDIDMVTDSEEEEDTTPHSMIHSRSLDDENDDYSNWIGEGGADDDVVNRARVNALPLMPGDMDSETEALENFVRVFQSRYGDTHPLFVHCSLSDVVADCTQTPPDRRRPICLYLHDDSSVSANVFASLVLCSEQLVHFLAENAVVWPWDLTLQENKTKLFELAAQHLGEQVVENFSMIPSSSYPLLILMAKIKGQYTLLTLIDGTQSLDEVMSQLMHGMDTFKEAMGVEVQEVQERERRDMVRKEQEHALQEAMAADRQKADERAQKEAARKNAQEEQQAVEQGRLEERERLARAVPVEPDANADPGVVVIFRIRLPDNTNVERRFFKTDLLQSLIDYIGSLGFAAQEHKVLTSFPKKDLTTAELKQSFQQLNMPAREALTVEKR